MKSSASNAFLSKAEICFHKTKPINLLLSETCNTWKHGYRGSTLLPKDHRAREVRRRSHVEQQRDRQKEIRPRGQECLPRQNCRVLGRRACQRSANDLFIIR